MIVRICLIAIFVTQLFATNKYVENLISQKAKEYKGLISSISKDASLVEVIKILKNNGLLELFFKKPKTIHPTFIFKNNSIISFKILYMTLQNLGYYYYYPSKVEKKDNLKITIEMKSIHHIDPLNFIKEIKNYGCKVKNIINKGDYQYFIECNPSFPAHKITKKIKNYVNINGEYWLNPNGFYKILIATSRYDNWYPYIVFYDKNLEIIKIFAKKDIQKRVTLQVPYETKYIKVRDNYTKENFKRGIYVKGLK